MKWEFNFHTPPFGKINMGGKKKKKTVDAAKNVDHTTQITTTTKKA